MIEFASLVETRVNDVVEALDAIYAETEKPVSARAIGEVVGMQSPQTFRYLHQAKDAGLAKPIPTHNPKWTKGWVPASVDIPDSPIVEGAKIVAKTLAELFEGKPIAVDDEA